MPIYSRRSLAASTDVLLVSQSPWEDGNSRLSPGIAILAFGLCGVSGFVVGYSAWMAVTGRWQGGRRRCGCCMDSGKRNKIGTE